MSKEVTEPLTPEDLQAIRERINHPAWVAFDKLIKPEQLTVPDNQMLTQSRIDMRGLLATIEADRKRIAELTEENARLMNLGRVVEVNMPERNRLYWAILKDNGRFRMIGVTGKMLDDAIANGDAFEETPEEYVKRTGKQLIFKP